MEAIKDNILSRMLSSQSHKKTLSNNNICLSYEPFSPLFYSGNLNKITEFDPIIRQ